MKIRSHLETLPPYVPIEPFEVLSARIGRDPSEIIKLDANENPYGPLPLVREALGRLDFPHIYPDPESRALMDASASNPANASLLDLSSDLADFKTAPGRGLGQATQYIGQVEFNWETTVETWASTGLTSVPNNVPKAVASAVRIYSRSFDLKTLPTF